MSTSEIPFTRSTPGRTRKIAVEAAIAGGLAASAAVLIQSSDPWMEGRALHPAWIATFLMAGYYGLRGLLAGPVIWSILMIAALATGAGIDGLGERLTSGEDLLMGLIAVALAGVAMVHERRRERLAQRVASLSELTQTDEELLEGLRRRVVSLRDRADRIEAAVPVWREVSERLASGTPAVAARAALDVCLQRTGARAGLVRRDDGGAVHNLAWRGQWSADRAEPRDIFPDRTIAAAIAGGAVALATRVPGTTAEDSDLAVPLRSPIDGALLGVLALRGVLARNLQAGQVHDVTSMASWLASTLATTREEVGVPAGAVPGEAAPPPPAAPVLRLVEDRP